MSPYGTLSAFGGKATEDDSLDKIGETLNNTYIEPASQPASICNQMPPEGNYLQHYTASTGTFASLAWDLATYGSGLAATPSGITAYTQFHL